MLDDDRARRPVGAFAAPFDKRDRHNDDRDDDKEVFVVVVVSADKIRFAEAAFFIVNTFGVKARNVKTRKEFVLCAFVCVCVLVFAVVSAALRRVGSFSTTLCRLVLCGLLFVCQNTSSCDHHKPNQVRERVNPFLLQVCPPTVRPNAR